MSRYNIVVAYESSLTNASSSRKRLCTSVRARVNGFRAKVIELFGSFKRPENAEISTRCEVTSSGFAKNVFFLQLR